MSWLPVLQKILKADDASVKQKIILVAEKDSTNGIIGLLNCIRKEPGGDRTRYVNCFKNVIILTLVLKKY